MSQLTIFSNSQSSVIFKDLADNIKNSLASKKYNITRAQKYITELHNFLDSFIAACNDTSSVSNTLKDKFTEFKKSFPESLKKKLREMKDITSQEIGNKISIVEEKIKLAKNKNLGKKQKIKKMWKACKDFFTGKDQTEIDEKNYDQYIKNLKEFKESQQTLKNAYDVLKKMENIDRALNNNSLLSLSFGQKVCNETASRNLRAGTEKKRNKLFSFFKRLFGIKQDDKKNELLDSIKRSSVKIVLKNASSSDSSKNQSEDFTLCTASDEKEDASSNRAVNSSLPNLKEKQRLTKKTKKTTISKH